MKPRDTLLIYCQHSLGMGHLIRSFALAEGLSDKFKIIFLNGGPIPKGIQPPDDIEVVNMPSIRMDKTGRLVGERPIANAKSLRRRIILQEFEKNRPSVVLIELFPFGRKKFIDELLPLLDYVRNMNGDKPLVLCSLRDILITDRQDQERHDSRASFLSNEYFDGLLVHSDDKFACLRETFNPRMSLKVPVVYTGFIHKKLCSKSKQRATQKHGKRILVSAGGGIVGGKLFRSAVIAHRILWKTSRLPMTLVTGPFFPDHEWDLLKIQVGRLGGIELVRTVPDLCKEMQKSALSLSQCGYNTTMDILNARIPACVVPFTQGRENEQMLRALKLEKLGIVKLIDPNTFNGALLSETIRNRLNEPFPTVHLNLEGVKNTVAAVENLLEKHRNLLPKNRLKTDKTISWLRPLNDVLNSASKPVTFFFRDDDAGWSDDRLFQLLNIFVEADLPIDLAVIPKDLTGKLSRQLLKCIEASGRKVGVHQHGYAHVNHERQGRKSEFGKHRSYGEQFIDIKEGANILEMEFGLLCDKIFTPPWNRCTKETGQCLIDLGFNGLSREKTAVPLNLSSLLEIPIRMDWFAHRKHVRLGLEEFGRHLALETFSSQPVGVMFHHAVMDENEMRHAKELLSFLALHKNVKAVNMRSLSETVPAHFSGSEQIKINVRSV